MDTKTISGAESDLIYDVGMHKGEDTEFYLRKGFRVVAFEADPYLTSHCREKFKSFIYDKKLIIVEGAIIDTSETSSIESLQFIRFLDKSEWGTIHQEWATRPQNRRSRSEIITVKAVDFKECLKAYGMPYYLKIDIEGSDLNCLHALLDFDARPDFVSIESEKRKFSNLLKELKLLDQLGYSKFQVVQQATVKHQREPLPAREGVYAGYQFQPGSSGLFGSELQDEWVNSEDVALRYRRIFYLYKLFGDDFIRRFASGRFGLGLITRLTGIELPGWFDTHAAR